MGKRIAQVQLRSRAAGRCVARGRDFFIYFCHLTCRDCGEAKIWVGETPTALVFVPLVLFFFFAPLWFFLLRGFYLCAIRAEHLER